MAATDYIGKRILAIDYGKTYTGLAVCDELHIAVRPVGTLQTKDYTFFEELAKIIVNEKPGLIIIGAPFRDDNKNNKFIEEINKFAKIIHDDFQIIVEIVDESYTSKHAVEKMVEVGRKKQFRRDKNNLNKFAASVILSEFLG